MIQTTLRKIYAKLAEKHGVPPREIEKMTNSMFKLVKNSIERGEGADVSTYKNTLLHHFGTFHVLPKRLEARERKKENKDGKKKEIQDSSD